METETEAWKDTWKKSWGEGWMDGWKDGWKEAWKEAWIEGWERGIALRHNEIACAMLNDGMDISLIARYTRLSEVEIEKLRTELEQDVV